MRTHTYMYMLKYTCKYIANGHQHLSWCGPGGPHVAPMWSPSSPHGPHVVPIIPVTPTSSPSSPHHPCHLHVIPTLQKSTPNPPTPYSTTPRISKNSIRFELIKIIQFCLKIWNLWRLPHPWVGVWFGGWVGRWVGPGQIIKNWINLDLINNSILFEDLWFVETPSLMGVCMDGWVVGWVDGWGHIKLLNIK